MSNGKGLLLCTMAALAAPAAAQDMMSDVPVEFLAGRSELIVTAKVVRADKPLQMQILAPGENEPHNKLFTRYTLSIAKVIKDEGAAAKAKGAKVRPAPDKPDKTAAPRQITVLGKAAPPGGPMPDGEAFVGLRAGQSYLLMLRELANRPDYYLPAYHKRTAPATPEKIAEVTKAADPNTWPWGKAADGLQACLLPSKTKLRLQKSFVRQPGGPRQGVLRIYAGFESVVALRNTSEKPIRIGLYSPDRFLTLDAVGPGGQTISADLYKELVRKHYDPFAPSFTREIKPGEVVFIGAEGEARRTMVHDMALTAGEWKLKAGYRSTRQTEASKGGAAPLWTGKADAAPIQFEVQDLRTRPTPRPLPARIGQPVPRGAHGPPGASSS